MNNKERIQRALTIAFRWSQDDGAHHKAWVIDQMVRALTGCPYDNEWDMCSEESEEYKEFVRDRKDGDDGGDTYEWDVGIAP